MKLKYFLFSWVTTYQLKKKMKYLLCPLFIFVLSTVITSCVAVPVADVSHVGRCGVSPDQKILKIIDVAKATNSYYSISGYLLTPIILPTSVVISGAYVLTNNAYYYGKNVVQC